ncbi:PDR/VanB family oxidoreductase [Microbacterium lacus]|uniref:PDR/VanB family oxidoreductase n=1 Tax=Microbacterium lacus TaxID=415217 RepID=A0ABN2FXC7_9MICO
MTEDRLDLEVVSRRDVGGRIAILELRAPDESPLPEWAPGAHIDIHIADGLTRQYSLSGSPADRQRWRIAVLREEGGRGGSRAIFDGLVPGATVRAGSPRNHFGLVDADEYVFIAGGIGITPMVPMLTAVREQGKRSSLTYFGREVSSMAFADELASLAGVTIAAKDDGPVATVVSILTAASRGAAVYVCGPDRLVEEVTARCEALGIAAPRVEHFAPMQVDTAGDTSFDLYIDSLDKWVTVPPDRSIVDVVEDEGLYVVTSCLEGTCGSCETPILEGEAEHRDSVLSEEERRAQTCMMICVSRACTATIKLDL